MLLDKFKAGNNFIGTKYAINKNMHEYSPFAQLIPCEKIITRKHLPEMNKALTEKNERRDFYFLASY